MKILLRNGRIVGSATDTYSGPDEYIEAPTDFDISRISEYLYEGGVLTLYVVPSTCTRRQGRLALLLVNLLGDVESTIAGIPDPTQRMAAQIEYEAETWERANPFLQAMWAGLGGTEQELDTLFTEAAKL